MNRKEIILMCLLPLGYISSAQANNSFYPELVDIHYNLGAETCKTGFRPVARDEALRFKEQIMNKLGKWSYVSLADSWIIMGPGYKGDIKRGSSSSTACYPLNADTSIFEFGPIYVSDQNRTKQRVEWSLINDRENFIRPAAYLANAMGFAWVGGSASNQVGDDMNVSWDSSTNTWKIRGNSGPCSGYRCEDKTTITVKDFSYTMVPNSFRIDGAINSANKRLLNTISTTAINRTDIPQQFVIDISYNNTKSWQQHNEYSFSQEIALTTTFKSPQATGGVDNSVSVKFGATQGWGESSGGEEGNRVTLQGRPVVPANSGLEVLLNVYRADISYPYVFDADLSYELGFEGFMKFGGNGLLTHPTNRPNQNSTFAIGRFENEEKSLEFQWDNRDIPGINKTWDWNWITQNNELYDMRFWLGKVMSPKKAKVKGMFFAEEQYVGQLEFDPIELPQEDLDIVTMEKSIKQQLEASGLTDVEVSVQKTNNLQN
ncbi:aerolysin family beta-barrel pore-forming toxin [Vibrio parahaemolyticus]|nr:aerolysin family beta-barrel pore-forming toxin [Vibrio parahaemolyticus]ELB2164008.1 aerolysin family beta-barrel pore-forming toxin [Vibrio parahaemolyticus]ELB2187458.1 aerolysin family beta-barrel pore-forming toxin [Vibrio parahaemolyticus]ELB2192429.1 aerolysin family beta-barrel pore-forming toxin [Vibrio parahaemolyticus]ELB2212590.1 aerolysin family beta-barrel pore-forming toxin [Vibrio parahaemolyticus]